MCQIMGLQEPNTLESPFAPTWSCGWDGSRDIRRAWRCSRRRIRRVSSWRVGWWCGRSLSGRCAGRDIRCSIASVVLLSLLVSILPPLLLSTVLSSNGSAHVPAVPDAMGPGACLRILVDGRHRVKIPSGSTGPANWHLVDPG
jgi:hypothetical protein